jgi:hypothetical protein
MNKTDYRIAKISGQLREAYLQFKSVRKKRLWPYFWDHELVDCWRFVPYPRWAIRNMILYSKACPTKMRFEEEPQFVSTFKGQEEDDLGNPKSFAKLWSDIEEYFSDLRSKHEQRIRQLGSQKQKPEYEYL